MPEEIARGLRADWINGWLAALGVTVLCPRVRLSWTDSPAPAARFIYDSAEGVAEQIAANWPTVKDIEQMSMSAMTQTEVTKQDLSVERFKVAAAIERDARTSYLAAFLTDLARSDQKEPITQSPFYVSAPRGRSLQSRVVDCLIATRKSEELANSIGAAINGVGLRVKSMGLAFNPQRVASFVSPTAKTGEVDKSTDPFVEVLGFFGLSMLAVRGDGTHSRARGFAGVRGKRSLRFEWPAWSPALDRWAVDAFLDRYYSGERQAVRASYASILYAGPGNDLTRAFVAKRLS